MRGSGSGPSRAGSWSAVKTLLVINVVIFILCNLGNGELAIRLALHSSIFSSLQLWKLVTYMFTHVEFGHILCNMWSLWLFGGMVERALGKRRMLQLYLFSGLIGGVLWTLANRNNPMAFCIGASGATFGIMAAAAMAFPNTTIMMLFPPIPMKLRTMTIIFLAWEVLLEWNGTDDIAHLAHLGGALGAFIYMRKLRQGAPYGRESSIWRAFTRWLGGIAPRTDHPGSASTASSSSGPRRLGDLDSDEVDRVLDKLAATGRSSLTPREKEILEEASRRLKDQ